MAEADIDTSWLDQIAERLEGMTAQDLTRIERAGLRKVNEVVKPALVEATPMAAQLPTALSTALPIGKLKASVRARVLEPNNGRGRAAVVDFGKVSYVARLVDEGHALVKGDSSGDTKLKTKGAGMGRKIGHVAAHPFVRTVQDSLQAEAEEAMVSGADAEIEKIINGR